MLPSLAELMWDRNVLLPTWRRKTLPRAGEEAAEGPFNGQHIFTQPLFEACFHVCPASNICFTLCTCLMTPLIPAAQQTCNAKVMQSCSQFCAKQLRWLTSDLSHLADPEDLFGSLHKAFAVQSGIPPLQPAPHSGLYQPIEKCNQRVSCFLLLNVCPSFYIT